MPEAPAIWHDARLEATRFGPVHWFASIDSTNRYVLDAAADGAAAGLVAVADEQSAGRGRLGRRWHAPAGASLLVSVLLRPPPPRERWSLLTLAAALAAADAVARCSGVDAKVKWPNDLLVDGRKLAGILAEASPAGALVVGMGCNVHWVQFPAELAETATACNLCGRATTREELLVAWLVAFDRWIDAPDVVSEATRRSATVGTRVQVELAYETYEGAAVGLDEVGRLIVERDDARREVVAAGDVVHLRDPGRARRGR